MSEELKPCPFCGGEAGMDRLGWGSRPWVPQCVNVFGDDPCGCSVGRYATKEEAVAAWNRRASSDPAPLVWSSEEPKAVGLYLHRQKAYPAYIETIDVGEEMLTSENAGWLSEDYEVAGPIVVQEPRS